MLRRSTAPVTKDEAPDTVVTRAGAEAVAERSGDSMQPTSSNRSPHPRSTSSENSTTPYEWTALANLGADVIAVYVVLLRHGQKHGAIVAASTSAIARILGMPWHRARRAIRTLACVGWVREPGPPSSAEWQPGGAQ
jgi:hypothetical protein